MGTTTVIELGILAWVLAAILLALFLGRMIRLRDDPSDRVIRGPQTGGDDDFETAVRPHPGDDAARLGPDGAGEQD
ncbi:MAG TPA: hypothetical protein VIY28_02440 [Pseudonocardiaceae bacterium]